MRLASFAAIIWLSLLIFQNNFWLACSVFAVQLFGFALLRKPLELSGKQLGTFAIIGLAFVARWQLPSFNFEPWVGFEKLRVITRELCRGVSLDAQALVLGITNGDDSQLSSGLKDQMRELSLSHLTAVSGTNCSIVIAASFALLTKLGLRTRARVTLTLAVLALYLGLVGNQPSVLRAAAMSSFALLALLTSSRLNPVAVLAASVLAVLFFDPSLASDYGLALSALATLGLLTLAPRLYQKLKLRLPNWLALSVSVTVSAQVFCLPVLVLLQPEQSSLSIIANILVEPVIVVITLLGIAGTCLVFVAPISQSIFWLASLPAQYVIAVTEWLSQMSAPTVELGNFAFALTALVLLILLGLKHRAASSAAKFVAGMIVISIAAWQASAALSSGFPIANWFYASCDVGQGDATVIRSQGQIALIDVGRDPKLINRCLNALHIGRIDLLVLTHYDADHVAGLSGAIANRQVGLALVTAFQDERNWIQQELHAAGIRFVPAEKGMRGSLGNFEWLVLSPHHAGLDSEDANDGSVTMLWQDRDVNIMTLADLGQKGQMRLGEELATWDNNQIHSKPIVLKVSHHGSADQFDELHEWLKPTIATISVGASNSYGHPTRHTLKLLASTATKVLRTDQLGNISIALAGNNGLAYAKG
ncbi:MAG: ComEC/Rec2 family competence protein [Micrococcales bacterium]